EALKQFDHGEVVGESGALEALIPGAHGRSCDG
ncbi:MAG: hypothetical protein ACJAZN_002782, partial [Planctomycetota bacterium]